jgi:CTP:molybdopterin cytidylyltransferase MocA
MRLRLVVLAAGMGSRYGGLKQLDAVGMGLLIRSVGIS